MADFSALKAAIQAAIRQNGNNEITGNIMQGILLSMVNTLGDAAINALVDAVAALSVRVADGYMYGGIATPTSTPTASSGKVFYFALQAGTYTNYGALVVGQGISILKTDNVNWTKDVVWLIDNEPTAGSDNLVKSGGTALMIKETQGYLIYDSFTKNDGENLFYDISAVIGENVPLFLKVTTNASILNYVVYCYDSSEQMISDVTCNIGEELSLNIPNNTAKAIIFKRDNGGDTNGTYLIELKTLSFDQKLAETKTELQKEIIVSKTPAYKFFLNEEEQENTLTGILGVYALKDFRDDTKEYFVKICGYRDNAPSTCFLNVADQNNVTIEQTSFSVAQNDVVKIVDCAGFRFFINAQKLPANSTGAFIGYNLHINKFVPQYSQDLIERFDILDESIEGLNESVKGKAEKKDLFYRTVNLFDGQKILDSWILSTVGYPTVRSGWFVTKNLIPVEYGREYRFSIYNGSIRRNMQGYFCEFDQNGEAIIRENNLYDSSYKVTDSSVKYIKVSFSIDSGMTADSILAMVYEWNARTRWMSPDPASEFFGYQVPYEDYGYERVISLNYCHRSKKMVCMGDSITDFGFYPEYAGYVLEMNAFNAGFGGARITNGAQDGTRYLSIYELAQAIVSGDFTDQILAAQAAASEHPNWPAKVQALSQIDFDDVDIITIAAGVNDFSAGIPIGEDSDSEPTTIKGALNAVLEIFKTNYPKAQIVIIPPMYRRYDNTDSDSFINGQGAKLPDVVTAEEEIARLNHCEYLELYYTLGVNKYNWQTYLIDGTHPTELGYKNIGRRLGGYLMSH